MAFDPGPCGPQFEDWEAAYLDWRNKNAAANREATKVGVVAVFAAGVCIAAGGWPCIGLAGGSLIQDASSVSATNARNAAYITLQVAKNAYKDCVKNHKHYYGEQ